MNLWLVPFSQWDHRFQKHNTTGDWEINSRIESAKNKFSSMKNVLLNHNILLQTRLTFLRAYIRSRLTFNCQNWVLTSAQTNKLDSTWSTFLRKMIRNGYRRKNTSDKCYKLFYTNNDIHNICKTCNVSTFIKTQQRNYAAHLVRSSNELMTKKLFFQQDKCTKLGRNTNTLLKQVLDNTGMDIQAFVNKAKARLFWIGIAFIYFVMPSGTLLQSYGLKLFILFIE